MDIIKTRPVGTGCFIKYRDINTYEVKKGELFDYDYVSNTKRIIDENNDLVTISCWQWELI